MRYNILINSKNKVGGDNPSNYKYNFNFSEFKEGDYELGFNFNTKGLKTVQATPILIGDNTDYIINTTSFFINDVNVGYEYALSNGTPYETNASEVNGIYSSYNAFNNNNFFWFTYFGRYDGSGNYLNSKFTTTTTGENITGEWLQIKLPYQLNLKSFNLKNASSGTHTTIKDFSIVGSTNETDWDIITTDIFPTSTRQTTINFSINSNTNYYNYYRLIFKNTYGGNSALSHILFSLFGETRPVNNASPLQIELEGLGATKKSYTTTDLTAAKNSNVIGTIPLSKLSYYNTPYTFNNLITINSKPLSSEITINLKKINGELFNIGEDYSMVLSFLKK